MTTIRDVFECASWTPIASAASEGVLRMLECRLNCSLPYAFRDLLALQNGLALLGHFSNSDVAIPADQLAKPLRRWPGYDPLADQLLPFMVENQGVCVWAIPLNAGDDPPQTYGWPGSTNYRFCNARSRLLLWDGNEHCDWWILPTSAEPARALDEIEEIAGIGDNIYALWDQHERTLQQWRVVADRA